MRTDEELVTHINEGRASVWDEIESGDASRGESQSAYYLSAIARTCLLAIDILIQALEVDEAPATPAKSRRPRG